MVIDVEITLNRFGFGRIPKNKFQLFSLGSPNGLYRVNTHYLLKSTGALKTKVARIYFTEPRVAHHIYQL